MSASTDQELVLRADRFAIQELIFRYSDAATRADFDQMRTVFAPDAVWESPHLGMWFDTAAAFIDRQREASAAFDVMIQTAQSPVVEIAEADRAKATTTVHEIFRGTLAEGAPFGDAGTEINVDQWAIYYDDLVRVEGEWLFAHRLFVPFLVATGTVSGEVVSHRPLSRPTP